MIFYRVYSKNDSSDGIVMSRFILYLCFISAPLYGQIIEAGLHPVFDLSSNQILKLTMWNYHYGVFEKGMKKDWEPIQLNSFKIKKRGTYWLRLDVTLEGINPHPYRILGLKFWYIQSAYEIIWDGKILVAKNGSVGRNITEEEPGRVNYYAALHPDWTTPGDHELLIRCSNYHSVPSYFLGPVYLGWGTMISPPPIRYFLPFMIYLGIFLTAIVMGLSFYIGNRHPPHLIFSLISLFVMTKYLIRFSLEYFQLPTSFIPLFLWIIPNITFMMTAFLTVLFFIMTYNINRKAFHIGFTCFILSLISIFEWSGGIPIRYTIWTIILYTTALLINAMRQKSMGSLIALIGYIIGMTTELINPVKESYSLFINMGSHIIFLFSLIFTIGRQLGEQNRQHQQAVLRSHHLEVELLKKNIQPHFFMNTIFAIISSVRKEPKKAIKILESLAEEFRIINQISARKLIPLEEEIRLCRKHLEIMGFRKNSQYRFIVSGIRQSEMVPPMIFHTLIENGLKHAYKTEENGTFELKSKQDDQHVCYIMRNDGSKLKEIPIQLPQQIREGMGMKYIKARLEESYQGRWELHYGLKKDYWETEIVIKK